MTALRAFMALIGLLMVGMALGADSIGVSSGEGAGPGQIALFVTGATLFLVALRARTTTGSDFRSFGHQVARAYKQVAVVALCAVLLFSSVELTLIATSKFLGSSEAPVAIPRETVSYYRSQDWAPRYWAEHQASLPERYHPYVLWRRAPFSGQTINVESTGIRKTPGSDCGSGAYKVFMFGGSTMWGTGSPDWATIPAYFLAGLSRVTDAAPCVVNFGETGFVSTQSVLQLLLQLKAGDVPNLVIFYDGHNDVFVALQSGLAGVHENLREVAARMTAGSSRIRFPLESRWVDTWSTVSLVRRLLGWTLTANADASDRRPGKEAADSDAGALSKTVVDDYLANYEIVAALAQEYGFDFRFFWQPAISVGQKSLTPEEEQMKKALESQRGATDLYSAVYRSIEITSKTYDNLVYLGDLFDKSASQIWIDEWHVTPEGNRLVAERMLAVIASRYGRGSS